MGDACWSLNNAIFFTSVGITALIWGIGFALVMVLDGEYATKILMAIFTAGFCAGGVVAFIPNLRLAIFYNLTLLVPTIILMSVRQIDLPLAVAFLMFSVYMVFMANRGNREYWQALENEHLLMKKSDQLSVLSRIDGLTGLYNRRYFDECLDREWKKTSRLQTPPTAIICDIDYFKKINDQHGHQAGDEFLRQMATLLKTIFKRETDIVARFGGEEFIVLLTDTGPGQAFDLAEELRRRMATMRMPHKGTDIAATISIGIASASPGSDESRDALIARADEALYQAKREGRNRTIVAPDSGPSVRSSG
jgi:diguanylate cyclase (GGDEF)-like protein